jgi:DNA-binding FrmR family transcriptional regulator
MNPYDVLTTDYVFSITPACGFIAYPRGYVILYNMKNSQTALIHHISRLEGQLASVKKELSKEKPDCEKASLTLKAASRSFSTLRMSFVTCFLEKKFLSPKQTIDSTYTALLQVINS